METNVVILSAVRTPVGKFDGALSTLKAHELGAIVIREAIKRAGITADKVDEVFMGQVLTAGQGQNPSRQASLEAGLSINVPATIVSLLCGSSVKSVVCGAQAIKSGDAKIVVCGGQESMSLAEHSIFYRNPAKFGDAVLKDTLFKDGLNDAFHNYHMGITAENVAKGWKVGRVEQDKGALESQRRAAKALKDGVFKEEIVPVEVKIGRGSSKLITDDEQPRLDTTLEALQKLEPKFITDGTGTVTAGNASPMNDGAAAVVLASEKVASNNGLTPMARIVSYALTGTDPSIMGIGPAYAVKEALAKANWTTEDVDLYELNEAYAAVAIAVNQELGISADKVNVRGGAIALGHPLGASGSRVLVTLLYALKQTGGKKGVAALCIGGGMGIAMCVEMC